MHAALAAAAAVSALAWLCLLLHPARPWDLRPRDDEEPPPPPPAAWPTVAALVPARDEAAMVPRTLPALAAQDYPGGLRIVLVDDRSSDGTAAAARALALERVDVVEGRPLPAGWVGKVWALAQAVEHAGDAEWLLLTDADVEHAAGSLRTLVADALHHGVELDSRMALLRARTVPERLLIPAFVFFFACLYPMRWVGRGGRHAAAAGGCVLLRRAALERAGGMAAIRGAIIDDVNLARAVSRHGRVRLATSRAAVRSLRPYDSVASVWRMVRRTAFDQLGYSWTMLAVTIAGLVALFVVPPAAVLVGALGGARITLEIGALTWMLQTAAYLPAVRHHRLSPPWALALPFAGLLYAGMTVDSALRHARGAGGAW